jgi:hypothetical protein
MNSLDRWTLVLDRVLAIGLMKYPARTGLGVALGGTLAMLVRLLEPSFGAAWHINFAAVPYWGWFAPGILLMHLPTIRSALKQQQMGNDQVDLVLQLIDRANFTPAERRQQYRLLINRVRDSVQIQPSPARESKRLSGA